MEFYRPEPGFVSPNKYNQHTERTTLPLDERITIITVIKSIKANVGKEVLQLKEFIDSLSFISRPFNFLCITDNPYILKNYEIKSIPLSSSLDFKFCRLDIFNPNVHSQIETDQIFYIDINSKINRNMKKIFSFNGHFGCSKHPFISEFLTSNLMSFRKGELTYLYTQFMDNAKSLLPYYNEGGLCLWIHRHCIYVPLYWEDLLPEIKQIPIKIVPIKNPISTIPPVSILILCLNRKDYNKRCIESIRRNTHSKYQLVVIDNGSTDGTTEYLKTAVKENDILRIMPKNIGFGPGNNLAVSLASHEYICLLNNDCEVKEGWLETLFKDLESNGGMVGPSVCKVNEDLQNETFYPAGHGRLDIDKWSYLEGWCILMNKSTFIELDKFDPLFDPYLCEDTDLSFKCRKAGMRLTESAVGKILHRGEKTVPVHLQVDTTRDHNKKLYNKWKTKRVLVKRRGARGDVLLTTPIVRAIKKKNPNYEISFMTVVPEMIKNFPYVDRVIKWDDNLKGFDIVYDLSYEKKNHPNYIDAMSECTGIKIVDRSLFLNIETEHMDWARNISQQHKKGMVCFHTGRTWKTREWDYEKFRKVGEFLKKKGFTVLELGDRHTNYSGIGLDYRNMELEKTAALIKFSKLLIGIDSLLIHIAAAVDTPVIDIYGCSDPNIVWSSGVHNPIWNEKLSCRGCRHKEKGDSTFIDCEKGTYECLNSISAEGVINKISLLE